MLDRSVAPSISKSFSFEIPKPEIFTLSGGASLVYISGIQQEVLKFEVILKAGKWYEKKTGAAHFTSIMLDKGTSSRTSKEIADVLDYYGAQLEISSGYDFVSVSLYTLRKHLEELLPVFVEILTEPTFPTREFDLQKQIFIQNLEINEQKNSFVASKLLRQNIFGLNHPYGSSTEKNDIINLTVDDLKRYFDDNFMPCEIYLVGNCDPQQLDWIINQFSYLPSQNTNVQRGFTIAAGDLITHFTKPDRVQGSLRLGKQVINRGHADYFSLVILNHVLGGYFGSRLMKNIREEKGLTYGIYSTLTPFRNACMFSIGADVDKKNVELAIKEIKKEIKSLLLDPIKKIELDTIKNHLLGSLQLEVTNQFSVLDKIKNIRTNGLQDNYYQNLFEEIKSTTPEKIQDIASKYFAEGNFTEVVVG